MPELPEVETLRRGLQATVRGRRIETLAVMWPPFVPTGAAALEVQAAGRQITGIDRRGKVLIFDLDQDLHLLLHLKMTGQVVVRAHGRTLLAGGHPTPTILGPMPIDSTRAAFALSGSHMLFVNDQRKFGWLRLVTTAALEVDPFLMKLGPEPLTDAFTPAALQAELARHRSAPIKAVLLDQSTVAGLGNIYTDECLHLARIDPREPAASLTDRDVRRLHAAIRRILSDAIEHGGTSFAGYVNEQRHRDTYLDNARLFGRQGQPCPVCGTLIERIRVAGRGTNYCPQCQR